MPTDNRSPFYPSLTPKVAPWMREVTQNRELVSRLLEEYGSPVNLHNPGPFADNYKAYKTVLDRHELRHTIFFARKANTCRAFAGEAHRLGFGVDTASYRELKQCLKMGCDPDRLVLTAAVKNERLVRLVLSNDVVIMLDNPDECHLVNRLAGQLGMEARAGIRVSGFKYKGQKLYSRFGVNVENAPELVSRRFGPDKEFSNIEYQGLHFHLDGYSIPQRRAALLQTIQQADILHEQGISTSFIDIGGGLLVNYLKDQAEWETFWEELKKAVRGEREALTFGNNGLGYEMIDKELQGAPEVYPYYNETPKAQFLDAILSHKGEAGQTVAAMLRQRNIELRMEPGRSLLDKTGLTLARVIHRKKDSRGRWLVSLEMNRSQLASASADFLLDPIFISMNEQKHTSEPTPVYFTGGYCLEQDLILQRKILLPHLPAIGDVIAFPNTAGYMMHFYETRSHLYEFATNLVARSGSLAKFIKDENWR